jgi:hypothetical protein
MVIFMSGSCRRLPIVPQMRLVTRAQRRAVPLTRVATTREPTGAITSHEEFLVAVTHAISRNIIEVSETVIGQDWLRQQLRPS